MKTYTINVTARDIKSGVRGASTCCPIALACRRSFRIKNKGIFVTYLAIYFREKREAYLPQVAKDFIKKFDTGFVVKPFKFKISL